MHLIGPSDPLYHPDPSKPSPFTDPFWAFVWPGSWGIAEHLRRNPALVQGKIVLDFAAGCGVSGIAAAQLGAKHVCFNDIDEVSVAACSMNAALNDLPEEQVGLEARDLVGAKTNAQVILAGDVCYEAELAASVMGWLREEARRGVLVLVGDPGRWSSKPHLAGELGVEEKARFPLPAALKDDNSGLVETSVFQVRP
ncbi:hypothetical protein TeGR_g13078 [Tetraparma gracilis]|jgi:predicted nicotinamide N-methyase|uniref:ETFB lysine methyltransferase n=1 Tax=Tetraparma gracilis TaxID=2962635 RepID=A0ABQ6MVP3_9STRA|nr:hypothetical protein TeGR_g13078 [Tetraparma gracilis]